MDTQSSMQTMAEMLSPAELETLIETVFNNWAEPFLVPEIEAKVDGTKKCKVWLEDSKKFVQVELRP